MIRTLLAVCLVIPVLRLYVKIIEYLEERLDKALEKRRQHEQT